MAASLRIVTAKGAKPRPDRYRFIDNIAISDAEADRKAGDSHLYTLMEDLFAGGDLSQAAWVRYCATYETATARLQGAPPALGSLPQR